MNEVLPQFFGLIALAIFLAGTLIVTLAIVRPSLVKPVVAGLLHLIDALLRRNPPNDKSP